MQLQFKFQLILTYDNSKAAIGNYKRNSFLFSVTAAISNGDRVVGHNNKGDHILA